ncbi:MAG: mechanosensitive ion channel [Phycisphaerae bacterium]|nr:mechanosensitive ion channel [Phycisphaerae bacterium]
MRFVFRRSAWRAWTAPAVILALLGAPRVAAEQQPPTEHAPASQPAASQPASVPAASAPAVVEAPPQLTEDEVNARIKQVQEKTDLDEEARKRALDLYQQALSRLKDAAAWSAKAADFRRRRNEAPAQLESLRAASTQPVAEAVPDLPSDATLSQLEQLLAERTRELEEARKALGAQEAEPKRRSDRRVAIPKELARLKEQLEGQTRAMREAAASGEAPDTVRARQALAQANRQAIVAEIECYEQELALYEAATELLPLRLDDAIRHESRLDRIVKAWNERVNDRRKMEAERQAREALWAAARAHPALAEIAQANADLAAKRSRLALEIERVSHEKGTIDARLKDLTDRFKKLSERVETAGARTMARPLMVFRSDVPAIRRHKRSISQRQSVLAATQLESLEIGDQQAELARIDDRVEAVVAELKSRFPDLRREEIEAEVRTLLQARREFLQALGQDYENYLGDLSQLNSSESRLVRTAESITNYISERILWIRSSEPIGAKALSGAVDAFLWFIDAERWGLVLAALTTEFAAQPILLASLVIALVGLVTLRPRLKRAMTRLGDAVPSIQTDSFVLTIKALFLTLLLAAIWPVILELIAWRLNASSASGRSAKAVAAGLHQAAMFLLVAGSAHLLLRPGGLFTAHFRWRKSTAAAIRKYLFPFIAASLPLLFVHGTMEWLGDDAYRETLGRLALISFLCVETWFAQRVFRPHGAVMCDYLSRHPDGWATRLRYVWYPLLVLAPLGLAILATAGFYFTATDLERRFTASIVTIIALLLGYLLLFRWLFVSYRHLAYETALKRREAEQAKEGPQQAGEVPAAPLEGEDVDLTQINQQTQRLIRTVFGLVAFFGVGVLWVDVLPALNVLNRVELWSHTARVPEEVSLPDETRSVQIVEKNVPITLADLLGALIVAVVTFIAAGNIPGLMEITLLQRLPLDAGSRYAFKTVCRYLITIVGLILAFRIIGVDWNSVQWMAAALTFGLAFGLQEIFANFISGLILLFERPIRVGDIVTIGDVSGAVTRIRIRATTVMTGDRKELIVPNKEFITGRVVNWTLTDPTLRIVLPVGVAYGSDTLRAIQLLLRVARENPRVLREPEPRALFMGFGDSTLNFELWVFVRGPEDVLTTRHDLNMAIDRTFRDSGIEIAFPQRDLHIRSMSEAAAAPLADALSRRAELDFEQPGAKG